MLPSTSMDPAPWFRRSRTGPAGRRSLTPARTSARKSPNVAPDCAGALAQLDASTRAGSASRCPSSAATRTPTTRRSRRRRRPAAGSPRCAACRRSRGRARRGAALHWTPARPARAAPARGGVRHRGAAVHELVELAHERRAVVLMHAAAGSRRSARSWSRYSEGFPDARLVLAHRADLRPRLARARAPCAPQRLHRHVVVTPGRHPDRLLPRTPLSPCGRATRRTGGRCPAPSPSLRCAMDAGLATARSPACSAASSSGCRHCADALHLAPAPGRAGPLDPMLDRARAPRRGDGPRVRGGDPAESLEPRATGRRVGDAHPHADVSPPCSGCSISSRSTCADAAGARVPGGGAPHRHRAHPRAHAAGGLPPGRSPAKHGDASHEHAERGETAG